MEQTQEHNNRIWIALMRLRLSRADESHTEEWLVLDLYANSVSQMMKYNFAYEIQFPSIVNARFKAPYSQKGLGARLLASISDKGT